MGGDTVGYDYIVIQESVSSEDVFPHKTHEGIKQSLFKLITSSSSSFTIGLEGQWGTGKSTVIHLLEEEFKRDLNKKTLFFTFDAWAHEGDPLRRVFLETLISNIDKDNFLDELLKEITGQKKTVEVTTSKQTSKFADYLAGFTLLVPIGAAILSAINYDNLFAPWSSAAYKIHYPFVSGLILSLAPLLLVLYWSIFGKEKENGDRDWSLLASNSTESYVQSITEENEKSSVEFERFFSKILNHIIGEDRAYDRVIIVVDNLDRVDAEHARQLWSTLQPFFLNNTKVHGFNWRSKVWFIVPYDREGLSKIWGAAPELNKEPNSNISQSFFSKCFQVIAEVPSPVFSGWCDYLSHTVSKALSFWPEIECQQVINTFKKFASRLETSPTPRQINNFINQVGFIGVRWGGLVSGEAIALYALFRTKYTESQFRRQLLDSQDVPEGIETINEPLEIKQELAGLLFGVSKSIGFELLLKPEINNAIISGDSSVFKKLIETHNEAFWITWTAVKSEYLPTISHSEEFRVAATKAIYEGFSEKNLVSKVRKEFTHLEQIWKQTTESWRLGDKLDYLGSLKLICENSLNSREMIAWLNQIVSRKLSDFIGQVGRDDPLNIDEFNQLKSLIDYLEQIGNPLKRFHYGRLSEGNWLQWLAFLKENNLTLKNVLPAKGTIEALGKVNASTVLTYPFQSIITTYKIFPTSNEWDIVFSEMVTLLTQTPQTIKSDLFYELMLMLVSNAQRKNSFKSVEGLNQFWTQQVDVIDSNKSYFAVLAAVVMGEDFQKNTYLNSSVKDYWSQDNNSTEKLEFVSNILKETKNLSALWHLLRDEKNKFALDVLEANIHDERLFSLPNALLNAWYYRWIGDERLREFISLFCKYGAYEGSKEELKRNPQSYDYELYKLQTCGYYETVIFVNELISTLSKETWREAFENNSWLLNCVFNIDRKLDHKYKDAFEGYYASRLERPDDSNWQWENFGELFEKTIEKARVIKRLTIKYFDLESDNLNDVAFNVLSGKIANQLRFVKPQRIMDRLSVWIDNEHWTRVVWLSQTGREFSCEPLESLETRLIELMNSQNISIAKEVVTKLAEMFNIDLNSSQEATTELPS